MLLSSFILKYEDLLDWNSIIRNLYYPLRHYTQIIDKHFNKLDWDYLLFSSATIVAEEIIDQHFSDIPDNSWWVIFHFLGFSEKFWRKYIHKLNQIDYHQSGLSSQFYFDHWDMLTITVKCQLEYTPEQFQQRIIPISLDELDWNSLSQNESVPEWFYLENLERVSWYYMAKNNKLSKDFISRFAYHLELRKDIISSRLDLDYNFLKEHNLYCPLSYSLRPDLTLDFINYHLFDLNMECLTINRHLDLNFFEDYHHFLDWSIIAYNPIIDEDFYLRHSEYLTDNVIADLCQRTDFSSSFYEKFIDKVCWVTLSWAGNLNVTFWENHLQQIRWDYLCQNGNIPLSFYLKYLDKIDLNKLSMNGWWHQLDLEHQLEIKIKKLKNNFTHNFWSPKSIRGVRRLIRSYYQEDYLVW